MDRSETGRTVALGIVAFAATLIVLAGLVSVVGRAPAATGSPAASRCARRESDRRRDAGPDADRFAREQRRPLIDRRRRRPHPRPPRRRSIPCSSVPGTSRAATGTTTKPRPACWTASTGTIFTAGDNVYPSGTSETFAECFDPAWGRHLDRIRPAPGNHDWETGTLDAYLAYFGAAAVNEEGDPWYAFDLGTWQVIVLDSDCSRVGRLHGRTRHRVGGCRRRWRTPTPAARSRSGITRGSAPGPMATTRASGRSGTPSMRPVRTSSSTATSTTTSGSRRWPPTAARTATAASASSSSGPVGSSSGSSGPGPQQRAARRGQPRGHRLHPARRGLRLAMDPDHGRRDRPGHGHLPLSAGRRHVSRRRCRAARPRSAASTRSPAAGRSARRRSPGSRSPGVLIPCWSTPHIASRKSETTRIAVSRPSRAGRTDPAYSPSRFASSSAVRSWLTLKLPRSNAGSPIPAYSQSTIRMRDPSSMKLALSRSLWHGRSSTGSARQASSIRRPMAAASSYSPRDRARRGPRPGPGTPRRSAAGRTAPGSAGRRGPAAGSRRHAPACRGSRTSSTPTGEPSMKRVTR